MDIKHRMYVIDNLTMVNKVIVLKKKNDGIRKRVLKD